MKKKMVLIGAGSAMFTQGLVIDLIDNSAGHTWELALVDIDEIALQSAIGLARKIVMAKKADIEITGSIDRREVLANANYVVITIGVGGRRAWEQDVFIPRKYGIYQPVGDTAMPGGISRAMRMIPAMLNILNDVKAICPNAFVFNYANPMAIICRAIDKEGPFPVTGLCHGVVHTEHHLADALGLDRSRFTALSVGLNHLTFMYDIRYDGKDLKPAMHEYYAKNCNKIDKSRIGTLFSEAGDIEIGNTLEQDPLSWEFFENYDVFPAPGDRHIVEFFTESVPNGMYYGNRLGMSGGYSFEGCILNGDKIYDRTVRLAMQDGELPSDFFDAFSGEHEQLMDIITSIESDSRKVFSANIPHKGAVSGLPEFAVLEMPGIATAKGFRALQVTDFPTIMAGYIGRFLPVIELAVDAALKGDRRLFEEAILSGGYICDRGAVSKMVDELLLAQKEYLPQF